MKIVKTQSKREDWDEVRSWNYKLTNLFPKMSVVYAELDGSHGEVKTKETERVYYILEGRGEFTFNNKTFEIAKEDVITVPPNTVYNYKPVGKKTLKVILYMELWDN
ncbi:MAG: cupin domain-containing protein [Candidatus Beckwithbacteria bacterium]|nr:cupin domain-containing protein [Patescibacteria group bacterium]